jgi:solute carrier family 35 protein C2
MSAVTPSGHRRRRSSLINPANASNSRHRSPRPVSVSQSRRAPLIADDEGKIVEESSDGEPLRPGEGSDDELTDEDLHDDEETGLTGKDKRRRGQKKRRNQMLDQRVVSDDISPEEKKEADRTVARSLVVNGTLIGLWYFFSLLISLVWTHKPNLRAVVVWNGLLTPATSTTNGCSHPTSSTFVFPCLLPPCISSCNLL